MTQTAWKSAQKRRKKRESRLKFLDFLKVRVAFGKKLKHHERLPKNGRKQSSPNFSIRVQISSKKDVKNQKSFWIRMLPPISINPQLLGIRVYDTGFGQSQGFSQALRSSAKMSRNPMEILHKRWSRAGCRTPDLGKVQIPRFWKFWKYLSIWKYLGGPSKNDPNRMEICSKKA